MTPYDIYRKFKNDIVYVSPEDLPSMLVKVLRAIQSVEEIYDQGPNTDAASEAIEVIVELRRFEAEFRLRQ